MSIVLLFVLLFFQPIILDVANGAGCPAPDLHVVKGLYSIG